MQTPFTPPWEALQDAIARQWQNRAQRQIRAEQVAALERSLNNRSLVGTSAAMCEGIGERIVGQEYGSAWNRPARK